MATLENKVANDFFKNNPNPFPQFIFTTLVAIPESVLQDALLDEKEEAIRMTITIAAKHRQKNYLQLLKDFSAIKAPSEKMLAWNNFAATRYSNLIKALQTAGFPVKFDPTVILKVHHDAFLILREYIQQSGIEDKTFEPHHLPISTGTVVRSVICSGIVPTAVLEEIIQYSNGLIYSRGAGSGYYEAALMKCGATAVVAVDLSENEYTRAGTVMYSIITDAQRDLPALKKMADSGGCVWYNWPAQGENVGYHGLTEAIHEIGFRKFVVCGDFSYAWSNPTELTSPMFPPQFAKSVALKWKLKKVSTLIPWSQKHEHCLAWFWELNKID